jgi:integrase
MSNATVANWLKDFEIKNNLKRVTLHGLRHTIITMQIVNGVDIKTVSARAGHRDIQTTLNIYSHYTKESDQKASELINKILYK